MTTYIEIRDTEHKRPLFRTAAYSIPSGATLVEAYETESEYVICGYPAEDTDHNCDQMGCSSVNHVVCRVPKDPWISVSDRLPARDNNLVLAKYRSRYGWDVVVRALYAREKELLANMDCADDFAVYDEESDEYYCPEGWYECNSHEETHWKVDEEVTHWMPLPAPPQTAAKKGGK